MHYFGHGQSNVNILLYFIDFWAICQVENENFLRKKIFLDILKISMAMYIKSYFCNIILDDNEKGGTLMNIQRSFSHTDLALELKDELEESLEEQQAFDGIKIQQERNRRAGTAGNSD